MRSNAIFPELRQPSIDAGLKDPLDAFNKHKRKAAERGIAFNLTFPQWWSLWEPHYPRRGNRALDMCMCRTADKGAYEIGNVRIATNKENHHEKILEWRTNHTPRTYRKREYRTPLNGELVNWARNNSAFRGYREEPETT